MRAFQRLLVKIFGASDLKSEPKVTITRSSVQEPVITIAIGDQKLKMSTKQAKIIWGKLGNKIESTTLDKKKSEKHNF